MANKGHSVSKAAATPRRRNNCLEGAQQRLLQRQLEAEREEVEKKISTLHCLDEEVSRLQAEAQAAANRTVVIRGSMHPGFDDQIQLR